MKIGVLALQGDFIEHVQILKSLATDTVQVRKPEQLFGLQGLIIPGGESTTFGKLAVQYGLIEPIRQICNQGIPVWGTCAGMIMLAKDAGRTQPLLGVMNIEVKRNAFGRQLDSFEQDLNVPALESVADGSDPHRPFHAIFIRAPLIKRVGQGVKILAELEDGTIVVAQQDNLLATAFHPELTHDTRFHRYFLGGLGKRGKSINS